MKQLTIFDVLPDEEERDFTTMTPREIADAIGEALGVSFEPDNRLEDHFKAQPQKGIELQCGISHYTITERYGQPFISISYQKCYGNWEGFGCGCDSLSEAINRLKGYKRLTEDKK